MWISGNTSKKTSTTITNPRVNYTPLVSCSLGSNHRNNHPPFPTLHHANVCKSTRSFTGLVTDHTATPLTHTTSESHTQTITIWLPIHLCQMGPDWSTGWVSWHGLGSAPKLAYWGQWEESIQTSFFTLPQGQTSWKTAETTGQHPGKIKDHC
jgi:hypothetical protein